MNLKRKDTPESAAYWDYAERVTREVEAEITAEKARQQARIPVDRDLVIRADSLLSLVRHRYRVSTIPEDICQMMEDVALELRKVYEATE